MFYLKKLPFVPIRNELASMMKELICSVLLLCRIIGTVIPNSSTDYFMFHALHSEHMPLEINF